MSRLIIVANRLPVTVKATESGPRIEYSSGGLAVGLRGVHRPGESTWIGWPGEMAEGDASAGAKLLGEIEELGCKPVTLTAEQVHDFYETVANELLWPVLHSRLDKIPLRLRGWEGFREVSALFARAVVETYRPGDLVWVHDYHLALVPQMVREQLPDARIGFFLHVPFPPEEVFRCVAEREELITGMMGADLIGFHTPGYATNFQQTARSLLRIEGGGATFAWQGRSVRAGAFPMGVDTGAWTRRGADAEVREMAASLRSANGSRRLVVGIDRLDYTKGIPRRLLAIEEMFERGLADPGDTRMIQVSVPSREGVDAYQEIRRVTDELTGRINGLYSTVDNVPIHSLYRSLSADEVASLYLAADVMLVTPLRDGMNLVAKEFVATRVDGDGVLVLSEFAGAAAELREALLVNPYSTEDVASAVARALAMPAHERRWRMERLRMRVGANNVKHWAESFLSELARPLPAYRSEVAAIGTG
ncbi:hypothetical protein EDM76_00155 [bacterium]|nr:MAG: hypothetical protein EDM76_00155 [bacterium]MCL4230485.1 trehalose-6-phosphate synthase [Dehalococcoidia bacterium]